MDKEFQKVRQTAVSNQVKIYEVVFILIIWWSTVHWNHIISLISGSIGDQCYNDGPTIRVYYYMWIYRKYLQWDPSLNRVITGFML